MKILLVLLFISSHANASIKARAREHYEVHSIKQGDDKTVYRGFSNTMNVWYEEPYKYSIGLSFSPIFGSSRATDDNNKPYGDKVKLISTGIEYKVFLTKFLLKHILDWVWDIVSFGLKKFQKDL